MYPVLYKSNETNFIHNGLGFMRDAITVYPEEELNGLSEIVIEYDADGFLADQISNGMIIKAKANDKQQPQLFRIYSHVKDHATDNIIINGKHITEDLADNFVEKLEVRNVTTYQAMKAIQEALAYPTRFNLSSTNTTTQSSTNLYRNNPLQMVAGVEGSVLDHWGGQIERDNFNLILHRRRGSDDGVKVLYKKNLTGLQAIFDDNSVVTRIYPFKYIEETEDERARLITVPGKYIDSPNIDKYTHVKIQPIDASSKEGIENSQDLYNAYKDYFKNEGSGKDLPSVSMDVEFESLWETEEYKDVAALELVGMGDTVTVGHSGFGLDLKATVVKIEYDSIAEKNRKVSLGNIRASFTDSVNQNANDLGVIGERMNQTEQKSNEAIRAANGKNNIYKGPDEPTGNLVVGDLWFKEVDGGYIETYRYDGIQWQLIVSKDVKDIENIANDARNQADQAVANANLATQNVTEAITQAQTAFDEAQTALLSAAGLQSRMEDAEGNLTALNQTTQSFATHIENAEGDISSLTQTAQGLQNRVQNAEGNISTVTQLATTLQSDLRDAEGNINTLTQTASSLQSTIKGVRDDLDGIEIGEINLISKSDQRVTSSAYLVKEYLINENFIQGETYTAVIKGSINSGQRFGLWQNVGSNNRGYFESLGNGIFKLTFSSVNTTSGNERKIRIYNYPSSGAGSATIEWIKFVRGNKTSLSWTPAPEDLATQSQITQLSDNINARVVKGETITQINIDGRNSSVLIEGRNLILDGDTTVTGTFRVNNANITSVDAGKMTTGILDAGRVSVINLSANSITGGILQSHNSNTTFNLNTGNLTMQNATFTLGGGANIDFTNSNNRITYRYASGGITRSSGVGVGLALGGQYPYSFLGTTGDSYLDSLSQWFSGFIANTTARIAEGGANSINGMRLQLRNRAVGYDKGITFDFTGTPSIVPMNGHEHNYNIGDHSYMFNNLHIRRLYTIGGFDIFNNAQTGIGWRLTTIQESGRVAFRGLNGGLFNYDLGASESYNHFHFGYINNLRGASGASTSLGVSSNPYTFGHINTLTVHNKLWYADMGKLSDKRLKRNIETTALGLDFINHLNPVKYQMRDKESVEQGIIAQELLETLNLFNVQNQNVVSIDPNGNYGVDYTQLISPTIKAVQELDLKVDTEVSRLRKQNEDLVLKVAKLEERIHDLEVA